MRCGNGKTRVGQRSAVSLELSTTSVPPVTFVGPVKVLFAVSVAMPPVPDMVNGADEPVEESCKLAVTMALPELLLIRYAVPESVPFWMVLPAAAAAVTLIRPTGLRDAAEIDLSAVDRQRPATAQGAVVENHRAAGDSALAGPRLSRSPPRVNVPGVAE